MADVKINAFDIKELERSVNDSATRVSAIWISFLIFSLYLLTAATTVTQRQLLLADPVKLPVLNIELPLWGFFFLAPILFVILHIYVLLQVLLLGRTTAAYDAAVARSDLSSEENATLRQRLANTLFAQIFAGSPREREGFVGALLRMVVWITLAIGPVLILLAFQFSFLAYHSHIATWAHRILVLVELGAFFVIWPMALDARKDFSWRRVRNGLARAAAYQSTFAIYLLWPLVRRPRRFDWPRHQPARSLRRHRLEAISFLAYGVIALISLSLATFPGEPHLNFATLQPISSVQCNGRWVQQEFGLIDLRFDRLILPNVDVVNDEKLADIIKHNADRNLAPRQGERTQNFRNRDFNCGDFSSGDFRRVDLTGAKLAGANLEGASFEAASLDTARLQYAKLFASKLQAASLTRAELQGASLKLARLQGAALDFAQLQGAALDYVQLQGASLFGTQLQGATLESAQLQGVDLDRAQLQGVSLAGAQLQGASLKGAQLQGASLQYAWLQGASINAQLQGASLDHAQLQGASLVGAELQGTSLVEANTDHSNFARASVWRAHVKNCTAAEASHLNYEQVIRSLRNSSDDDDRDIPATPSGISDFFDAAFAGIPNASKRAEITRRLKTLFAANSSSSDAAMEAVWRQCEAESVGREDFNIQLGEVLRSIVCDAKYNVEAIAQGIVRNWVSISRGFPSRRDFSARLARGMLGEDGRACATAREYDKETTESLHFFANLSPAPARGAPWDGD